MITAEIPHKPLHGLIARLAIQCTCPNTGKVGDFLYSGETWWNKDSRVTPLFDSLGDCFNWLRDNGWVEVMGVRGTYTYRG